jgi:RNase P/RNase MRP subunit p30
MVSYKNSKEILSNMIEKKDFLIPQDNEEELIISAKSIGIKEIVLLYLPKSFLHKQKLVLEISLKHSGQIKISSGIIFAETSSAKEVQNAFKLTNIVVVRASENLRELIERFPFIYIYGLELSERPDFIHQRDSGINHILLAIATEKKTTFLFSFFHLLSSKKEMQGRIIGRLKQNLLMFHKYKVDFQFVSFSGDIYGIKSDYSSFEKLVFSNKI